MLRELELLVEAGIPPMEALISATRTPAEMLGIEGEVGAVGPGLRGDLLIVEGDPVQEIRALRRIRWVVRDGELRTPEGWMRVAHDATP
jgi:imidazolonepropionase-like amidohydrolase